MQDNDGSMPQIVFSPNITISGDADPAEVTRKTKELFKLFEQFLDQYFRKHNKVAYSR